MADLKCSFCLSEDDDRKYLTSEHNDSCLCSNCALMFAQYMLNQQEDHTSDSEGDNDKNTLFQQYLQDLEDKWMEKNVINSYILDAGGRINLVTFRFEDEGDDFYFVCELEVEGIDELHEDVERNILNEIEWAFDEIRDDLESEGLDLEAYLGERLQLTRVD